MTDAERIAALRSALERIISSIQDEPLTAERTAREAMMSDNHELARRERVAAELREHDDHADRITGADAAEAWAGEGDRPA